LTRTKAVNGRRVVNEEALWAILAGFGFQKVVMEDMALGEQIRLAASADNLVAPHGAGMVHCLFMPANSLVIELFSSNYLNPCMLPVISHLQHRYFMVPSPAIPGQTDCRGDIKAYLPMVEMTLRRELTDPGRIQATGARRSSAGARMPALSEEGKSMLSGH